ncbi:cupin domain-containing protein [Thioalkalivibrio sulfidiphilus]|uniref:cupin domain-containing protein n=1 Tax=Thioalkalivibrio sulfidiphilus TaxID=1033854 RepID=UPI00037E14AF|nr:cupin domain-containing protein [Thioalkalivibrio sulfidiphilus]
MQKTIDDLADVNADPHEAVRVDTGVMAWEPSPSGTVWRKPLYRFGGEFGPVTSLVRYAPGGAFRPHSHPEGEEILVLDGVFADEHGEYPAGTWFLSPDGSSHAPRSEPGCDLFVRLRQYPGRERAARCLDTDRMDWAETGVPGVQEKVLYRESGYPEDVCLMQLANGASLPVPGHGIIEILVLEGELRGPGGVVAAGTWMRAPAAGAGSWQAAGDCRLYRRITQS